MTTDFDNLKREMDSRHVKNLPPALGLCEECARKTPVRVQAYPAIYCRHNKAGAYFIEPLGIWQTFSPVDNAEFGQALGIASALVTHNAQAEAPPEGERH